MKLFLFTLMCAFGFTLASSNCNDADMNQGPLIYNSGDRILLHQPNSEKIVLVQPKGSQNFNHARITAASTEELVMITDAGDKKRFSVNDNLLGIAIVTGDELISQLVQDNSGKLKLNVTVANEIIERSCGCNQNGLSAVSCDSGGTGSTECSVTTTTLGIAGSTGGCNVKCGNGYYACCSEN